MFTSTIPSTRGEREREIERERHEDTVRELGLVSTVQKEKNCRPRVTLPKQFKLHEMEYNHDECF